MPRSGQLHAASHPMYGRWHPPMWISIYLFPCCPGSCLLRAVLANVRMFPPSWSPVWASKASLPAIADARHAPTPRSLAKSQQQRLAMHPWQFTKHRFMLPPRASAMLSGAGRASCASRYGSHDTMLPDCQARCFRPRGVAERGGLPAGQPSRRRYTDARHAPTPRAGCAPTGGCASGGVDGSCQGTQ